MKILLGKNVVDKHRPETKTGTKTVLFENETTLVSGEPGAKTLVLKLTTTKSLAIFGVIHAVVQNDKYRKFDQSEESKALVARLFSELEPAKAARQLEGHFIGVLCDGTAKTTIFADQFNRRELFFSKIDDGLVASTAIAEIIATQKDYKTFDQTALANVLSVYGNYAPKKQTIYKNIKRLGVGERIEFANGNLGLQTTPHIPQEVQEYGDDKLNEYSDLLQSAVDVRSSNSKNWIFMSSGWDSSALLAILSKLYGPSKIHCVIGRCRYSPKSGVTNEFEIARAKKITDYFSVPLDVVDLDYTKPQYLEFWNTIRKDFRSLHLYSLYAFNFYVLANYIAKKASPSDAIFNGEISDGAHNLGFSQYTTLLNHSDLGFREYSDKMIAYLYGPSFFDLIAKNKFSQDIIFQFLKSFKDPGPTEDVLSLGDKGWKKRYISSLFLSGSRMPFSKSVSSTLLTPFGHESAQSEISETYFDDFATNVRANTIYSWILHLYNSFHWQAGTVRAVIGSADHYKLQNSSPFWDTRVQNFLAAMPEAWGRGLNLNPVKYPLKWMLTHKVKYPTDLQTGPHSYLCDVDSNWSVDADILYASAAAPYFKDLLKSHSYEEVLDSKYFDLAKISKLSDDYVNGKIVTGQERTDLRNLVSLVNVGWF